MSKKKGCDDKGQYYEVERQEATEIAHEIWSQYFTTSNILRGITYKSKNKPNEKFSDLYSLLTREDLIYTALTNLKNNTGSATPGVDRNTLDTMSKIDITGLQQKLKEGKYTFKPIKRVMIPKPGKNTLRPLGIPTFEDRIVQEMIRMVLEAIYEPVFTDKHKNANYGFRPGKSCQQAIDTLYKRAQNTEWCIEGDIKGAYDNVDHKVLIKILAEKIEDKQFLEFIDKGLKSGSIHKGHYEHTLIGTPQGGIASPILFNIYMGKLDEFIEEKIAKEIAEKNIKENRKVKPATRIYRKYDSTISSSIAVLRRIAVSQIPLHGKDPANWSETLLKKYRNTQEKIKVVRKKRLKAPYLDKKNALLRYVYVRYADDWVFFTNGSASFTESIKEKISTFLLNDLKLTLSPEKTKVTNAGTDSVKFLGFSLGYRKQFKRLLTIKNKAFSNYKKETVLVTKPNIKEPLKKVMNHIKRTTGNQLIVGIDNERLRERLIIKGFLNKKKGSKGEYRGARKASWTTLTDYEIIIRFNQIIRGIVVYYGSTIRDFSALNQYIYILYYSCVHTLANKHNTSIRKIFNDYGNLISTTITDTDKKKNKEIEKKVTLLNYMTSKKFTKELETKRKMATDSDFLSVRINWRTTYKMQLYCVICGSKKDLELHHIKHVRKVGLKTEGFASVINSLNRKQICTCKTCHRRIHNGLYDGISLSEFYDPDLATF